MLKVISIYKIPKTRVVYLKKEIMDFLDINIGDYISYILSENGFINVRKFKGDMILGKGDKYIASAHVIQTTGSNIRASIASDVRQAVNVDIGDNILWILDSEGNIILRNTVILSGSSKNIFNKDITALVIGMSPLTRHNKQAGIPKEIVDILGVHRGYKVVLSLDEYGNIIVSKETRKNILEEVVITGSEDYRIYLTEEVIDILDTVDKILWFFDEEGNIIIKNNLLPDNCV